MKRSEALAPLSREHHIALDVALVLRRADEHGLPDAVDRYLQFFAAHGSTHFAEEEAVLVPLLPSEYADRLLAEHALLRHDTRKLEARADLDAAHRLGELLAAHVRFEEREAFPHLDASGYVAAFQLSGKLDRAAPLWTLRRIIVPELSGPELLREMRRDF